MLKILFESPIIMISIQFIAALMLNRIRINPVSQLLFQELQNETVTLDQRKTSSSSEVSKFEHSTNLEQR